MDGEDCAESGRAVGLERAMVGAAAEMGGSRTDWSGGGADWSWSSIDLSRSSRFWDSILLSRLERVIWLFFTFLESCVTDCWTDVWSDLSEEVSLSKLSW